MGSAEMAAGMRALVVAVVLVHAVALDLEGNAGDASAFLEAGESDPALMVLHSQNSRLKRAITSLQRGGGASLGAGASMSSAAGAAAAGAAAGGAAPPVSGSSTVVGGLQNPL